MNEAIKKAMVDVSLNGGTLYLTSDGQTFKAEHFAHSHSFNLKNKSKTIVSTEKAIKFERLIFKGSDWVYINSNEVKKGLEEKPLNRLTVKELKALAESKGLELPKGANKSQILKIIKDQL